MANMSARYLKTRLEITPLDPAYIYTIVYSTLKFIKFIWKN